MSKDDFLSRRDLLKTFGLAGAGALMGGGCGKDTGEPTEAMDGGKDDFSVSVPDGHDGLDSETALDAGWEGGMDAGMDAGMEGGLDAGMDTGMEGGTDAGWDAGWEGGLDAGLEGGWDLRLDGRGEEMDGQGDRQGDAPGPEADREPTVEDLPLPEGPPNILYIYSDQHRGDSLSSLGEPVVQTPNLDSIAAEGVAFRRCYTNAPLCRPGRACMMTGLYPSEHGVWSNNVVADPSMDNHVRRLRDEGYRTAVVGKTHLHMHEGHLNDEAAVEALRQWGFEESLELTGPSESAILQSAWTDFLGQDKYDQFLDYMFMYREKYYTQDQGLLPPPDLPPWNLGTDDHLDVFCGRAAADWIRSVPTDRPFYLQVGFPGPHPPFDAPQEWRDPYPQDDPNIPVEAGVQAPVPTPQMYFDTLEQFGGPHTEEEARAIRALYYAKVTMIDTLVGEILAVLRERGLLENTWIVFGADHGEMLGDHGLVGKIVFLEGSIHIPLIIRPPGGGQGWISEALTDQMDVTASILAMGGLEPSLADGRSLLETVEGGPSAPRAHVGKEQVFAQVGADDITRYYMVRTDRYKLVATSQVATELYDLGDDPHENLNRVNDPALETVQRDLESRLLSRFDR